MPLVSDMLRDDTTVVPAADRGTAPEAPTGWFAEVRKKCSTTFKENAPALVPGMIVVAIGLILIYHYAWPDKYIYLRPSWWVWVLALVAFLLFLWSLTKPYAKFFAFAVFLTLVTNVYKKRDEKRDAEAATRAEMCKENPESCIVEKESTRDTLSSFVTLTKSAPSTEVVVPLGYYYDVQSYDTTVKVKINRSTRGSDLVNTYTMPTTADSVRLLVLLIH